MERKREGERERERELAKEKFYAAKGPIKNCDVNVGNIVISKLVKRKSNSKYLIGCLNNAIRPLVLIMPKLSGCVKRFKVKEGSIKIFAFLCRSCKTTGNV